MTNDLSLIELFLFAGLAVFVILQLVRNLGRRNGSERQRDPFAARTSIGAGAKPAEKGVTPLPLSESAPHEGSDTPITAIAPEGSALNLALTQIQLADRSFELDKFMAGARAAYRTIVEAFARDDAGALHPLLSPEVLSSFEHVIADRKAKGLTLDFKLVAIKEASITAAKLEGKTAEITVTFQSEITTATKDAAGEVVGGDASTVATVIDVWSFARNVKSSAPDWLLIATDTAE